MTNAVRSHFHIWQVGQAYVSTEYHILFGGLKDTPIVIATHVRALNGASQPHVLTSGGVPVLIKDATFKAVTSLAEHAVLIALQGKSCYYLPLVHMADNETHHTANVPASPGYQVFVMPILDDEIWDPAGNAWITPLILKDDSF